MTSVRDISLIFCAAAVLTASVTLIGGGALEKSIKYITALILLCALVSSLSGASFNFDLKVDRSAEAADDTALSISRYQAEQIIGKILDQKDIEYRNISAKANKTEEGGIIISDVIIRGVDNGKEALDAIRQNGIDCRVIFE